MSKVDPTALAQLRHLAKPGASLEAIRRGLADRGIHVGKSTVRRWLAKSAGPESSEPASPYAGVRLLGERLAAAAPPVAPEQPAVDDALARDDLAALERYVQRIEGLIQHWAERATYEAAAGRQVIGYTAQAKDLRARLIELRPKPEAERDRLTELGLTARSKVIDRAQHIATEDERLRARLNQQAATLKRLLGDEDS